MDFGCTNQVGLVVKETSYKELPVPSSRQILYLHLSNSKVQWQDFS
jgi:hypothetical protein